MVRCAAAVWRAVAADLLPLAVLAAVAVYAVWPLLGDDRFSGRPDACWYLGVLNDARAQARAGTLPVGVGQSAAAWNGYPPALMPGLVYTALAIDLLTAGHLSTVGLLHATGAACVWGGALSAYLALRHLSGGRRWLAAALAALYVCCPAVLSILLASDMYPATVAVPLFPLLLLGLARRPDAPGAVLVGGALAALWMAHAGVALWCSTGTALFLATRAVLAGPFWVGVWFSARAAAVFFVLSAWFFATVLSLGLHRSHTMNKSAEGGPLPFAVTGDEYAAVVTWVLDRVAERAYRPLPADYDVLAMQQMGYALLGVLGLSAAAAVWGRSAELRLLAGGAALLILSVTPVGPATRQFWAHLPRPFLVTEWWPMLRFGILIAGMTVCAAAVAARHWPPADARLAFRFGRGRAAIPVRAVNAVVAVALAAGVAYSLHQVGRLHDWTRDWPSGERVAVLARPENQPLHWCNWLTLRDPRGDGRETNVKDPVLYDRVLSPNGAVVACNRTVARGGPPVPYDGPAGAISLAPADGTRPVARFAVEPGWHYLLTLHIDPRNADARFPVEGGTVNRLHVPPLNGVKPQDVLIPVWTTGGTPHGVRVSAECVGRDGPEPPAVRVSVRSLVRYDPATLPVRVRALRPYTADVCVDRPALLETHRQFVPGYEARVNGEPVEPTRSADGMLTVPLRDGKNEVVLTYRVPPLARAGLAISAAGWLAALAFAVAQFRRRHSAERPIR
jgi:hypothetical protein